MRDAYGTMFSLRQNPTINNAGHMTQLVMSACVPCLFILFLQTACNISFIMLCSSYGKWTERLKVTRVIPCWTDLTNARGEYQMAHTIPVSWGWSFYKEVVQSEITNDVNVLRTRKWHTSITERFMATCFMIKTQKVVNGDVIYASFLQ